MSKLEELIKQKCPEGVEYKKVSEMFRRVKGTPITAGKMKEIEDSRGEIRIFAGGRTVINAKEEDIPNANITRVPAVLVQSRGIIDFVYYEKPFTFKNEMWAYTTDNSDSVKFLYYVFKNNVTHFREVASGMGSLPQISLPVTEDFEIPVPPIEIQQEIVRILDKFIELEAGLQAELDARKKQYDYCRMKLLAFGEETPTVTLPEISVNLDRKRKPITGNQREPGEIPYYGASGVVDYVKEYLFDGDYLLVSEDGANLTARVTPIAFSISGKTWVNNHAHILQFQTDIDRKFVEYYLNSMDLSYYITGAAQPKLNQDNLNKIPIPNPSYEEKRKIVECLDIFSKMCNDSELGLTAEIEARRKQYEYYRDKLLTFKRKEA